MPTTPTTAPAGDAAPAPVRRAIGDTVVLNDPKYPGRWTIKSMGPVNATLIPESGGRGLRAPHYLLLDPTDTPAAATAPTTYYQPGEIVRITTGRYAGTYTVLADKVKHVNVALLGGDGGRYVRAPRVWLTRIAVADLIAEAA
jgi:hypothetical protein